MTQHTPGYCSPCVNNRYGITRRYTFLAAFLCLLLAGKIPAQDNPAFNVNFSMDYSAADQCLQLFDDNYVNTRSLAGLRGNLIAAATTGMIANRGEVSDLLKSYLDSLRYHQLIRDDVYNLEEARRNAAEIKELLSYLKKSNFSGRVLATVEQLFPSDVPIHVTIPVYAVALGHENVDAFVRRIIWKGDTPVFVGEGQGEATIVINLAQSVRFHKNVDERLLSLMSTVAHETFHAAFAAYKDRSSVWKRYYASHRSPLDNLLDLTQNEGIAYLLSLQEAGHGSVPSDWYARTHDVFSVFNNNAKELLSEHLTNQRAAELLRAANLSGFWESYGAMTGMFIAREIDRRLGRNALTETVSRGPQDFFQKYQYLSNQDGSLPRLDDAIIAEIGEK